MPANFHSFRETFSADDSSSRGTGFHALLVAAVWLSFLAASALRAPVPASNEPHYLCKAKHYWEPAWCSKDFFLQSADTHRVFYETFGWLTQWFTLPETAWIGRGVALLIVAVGWTNLFSRLLPGRWMSLWACWTFLFFAAVGNFSGEWVVGGVEAKVVAYGLVFQAVAFLDSRRYVAAGLSAGVAFSFHPLVGGWSLLAAGLAGLLFCWEQPSLITGWFRNVRNRRQALNSLGLLALCSLPGLLPVLPILFGTTSAETAFRATYIQVFFRLSHHLDPSTFPVTAYLGYGLLTALWLTGRERTQWKPLEGFFGRFVMASVLIAAVGWAIGFDPRPATEMPLYRLRMSLMKFYPFRLFDVMMPMAASAVLAGWLPDFLRDHWPSRRAGLGVGQPYSGGQSEEPRLSRSGRFRSFTLAACLLFVPQTLSHKTREAVLWLVFAAQLAAAFALPAPSRNPSRMSPRQLADWKAACRWIAAETPADSLVSTPRESWAFKWYARRAEFVCFKDCPQNARGIVEWNRRLNFLRDWAAEHYGDQQYSRDELQQLRRETGITHLVVRHLGPMTVEPIYQNATYRIYRCPPPETGIERG